MRCQGLFQLSIGQTCWCSAGMRPRKRKNPSPMVSLIRGSIPKIMNQNQDHPHQNQNQQQHQNQNHEFIQLAFFREVQRAGGGQSHLWELRPLAGLGPKPRTHPTGRPSEGELPLFGGDRFNGTRQIVSVQPTEGEPTNWNPSIWRGNPVTVQPNSVCLKRDLRISSAACLRCPYKGPKMAMATH